MEFKEAVRSVLGQYANFSGRATRSEYWWWTLFTAMVYFAFYFLILFIGFIFPPTVNLDGTVSGGIGAVLSLVLLVLWLVAMLAMLVPSLAVLARRLHDTNRSALFILLGFVPFVGGLIIIILCVIESDPAPNQYGPPVGSVMGWDPNTGAPVASVAPTGPGAEDSDGTDGTYVAPVVPSSGGLTRQRAKPRPDLPRMPQATLPQAQPPQTPAAAPPPTANYEPEPAGNQPPPSDW